MLRTVVVVACLCLVMPANGSQIEDRLKAPCLQALGPEAQDDLCQYQFDGGTFGDTGDGCLYQNKGLDIGTGFDGVLVPFDDQVDFIRFDAPVPGDLGLQLDLGGMGLPTDAELRAVFVAQDCVTPVGHFEQKGGRLLFHARLDPGTYALGLELVMPGVPTPAIGTDPGIEVPVQCRPYCAAQVLDATVYDFLGYAIQGLFSPV
ncbi:MAG: hypothetical protein ACPGQL_04040 [Thermoplasmatota archaeon]